MRIEPLSISLLVALAAPAASQEFGPQSDFPALGSPGEVVTTVDMDGDGDPDILSGFASTGAGAMDGKIVWYANLGGGHFGAAQQITSTAQDVESIAAADLDGDGDVDVLALPRGGPLAWYDNLGGGSFSAANTIAVGSAGLDVGDFDGDGDIDVLIGTAQGGSWCENLGGATFGLQQLIGAPPVNALTVEVRAADMDGDGDLDLLIGTFGGLYWFPNQGGGTFGPAIIIWDQEPVTSVLAADLDGDGDLDALTTFPLFYPIRWHENVGGGTFGGMQTVSSPAWIVRSMSAADLDADGGVDIVAGLTAGGNPPNPGALAWYENLGNGNFGGEQFIPTTANTIKSVRAADLDGDGDAEVLLASEEDNNIAWYENWNNASVGNPGFETGDLQGWTLTDNPVPYFAGQVLGAGAVDPPSLPFDCEPTEGGQAFVIGFDGIPATSTLSQSVLVTDRISLLTFNYRASWFITGPTASLDRTFDVVIRDFAGNPLQSTRMYTFRANSSGDLEGELGEIDLSAFEGQLVTISFEWTVPEEFTGPGIFQLDNIRCPSLIGPRVGDRYCLTLANSSGRPAAMAASGSSTATHNNLTIAATNLPPNQFGIFFTSMTQGFNPGASGTSNGVLCVGGSIGRYNQVLNSGAQGSFSLPVDLQVIPQGGTLVGATAGQTWNFQAWFRDGIGLGSNFTDGISIQMN